MKAPWKFALKNLRRNKQRTLATATALLAGCVGLILASGYIVKTYELAMNQAIYGTRTGHISLFKPSGLENQLVDLKASIISPDEINSIFETTSTLPEVLFTAKIIKGVGLLSNGCQSSPFLAIGTESESEKKITPLLISSELKSSAQLAGHPFWTYPDDLGAIEITEKLGELIGKPRVQDFDIKGAFKNKGVINCDSPDATEKIALDPTVQLIGSTLRGEFSAADAIVAGHFSTGVTLQEDMGMRAPLALLQKLFETKGVTQIAIYLRAADKTDEIISTLKHIFAFKKINVETVSYQNTELNPNYSATMGFIQLLTYFFLIIVVAVVVLSIINSVAMTIAERKTEIGTMRAFGFVKTSLASLLTYEIFFLSFFTMIAGDVLGLLLMRIINYSQVTFRAPGMAGYQVLDFVPRLELILFINLVIISVSVAATYLTALRAMRKSIVGLLGGR
jgi:putative ABC transport system permease protein